MQWQNRSLRQAEQVCRYYSCEIANQFHEQHLSWAGHLARLGVKSLEPHMAYFMLMWRPSFLWRDEQQLFVGIDFPIQLNIPETGGQPRRYEHGFATDWMMQALREHY